MIRSYKRKPDLDSKYDVILIGSGLGCLSCAALLSKEGKKVLVLEQHYTAGGYTHVFKRKGYEWDVGIHYVGEVGRPKSAMSKLFNYVSDGQLEWADMGEVYDRIFLGKRSYDMVKGVDNFKKKLKEYFPEESEAIDKYVDLVFEVNKKGGAYYLSKALPPIPAKLLQKTLAVPFFKFADMTTYQVLRSLTDNQELIRVLCGQYGDYGLPPKKSSFAMHATLVRHYFGGGYFPVGGSSRILESIIPAIEKAGGSILINAPVREVLVEKNKAMGVIMEDGATLRSDQVISGAGVLNSFMHLLPPEVRKEHKLESLIQKVKPSACHACLYIGLEGTPEELGLPKTNYWLYPEKGDHDSCVERYLKNPNEEFPVVYISFPASKDPDWQNRYPGRSTIDIITLVSYESYSKWEGTKWMKRGEEYEKLKHELSMRLLEKLFGHFPHLRDKVRHHELSSPLSTKHFTWYQQGEIYGIDHSPERFRQKFLQPRTPVKDFFLTGQDIVTAGIGGALFSGLLTASAITGKNLMKKVMKT